jgi:hypothetical protein
MAVVHGATVAVVAVCWGIAAADCGVAGIDRAAIGIVAGDGAVSAFTAAVTPVEGTSVAVVAVHAGAATAGSKGAAIVQGAEVAVFAGSTVVAMAAAAVGLTEIVGAFVAVVALRVRRTGCRRRG